MLNGLGLGVVVGLALPTLALHMASVMMAKALRTYSRSQLATLCGAKGLTGRAEAIGHLDEPTERAAESLAVLTGLALAALLGVAAVQLIPGWAERATVAIALCLGGLGYVTAGVLGRVYAEPILVAAWPMAAPLRALTTPLVWASDSFEAAVIHLSRRSAASTPRPASVEVEILSNDAPVAEIEADLADLPESAREMLERVVELSRMDVSEVMTPRSTIVALPASASPQTAIRLFLGSGRSRIPLFGEHRDDIVGMLYVKDLLAHLDDFHPASEADLRKLARPAMFVPETKDALSLLEEFRKQNVLLAIVVDEYGAVAGLVTLEDLLEQVVGAIHDEHDSPSLEDPVTPLGPSSFEVDGSLDVEQLNERLHLSLPTDEVQTVGGFAFNALGRLPDPGATFRHQGAEFTVLKVADRSIRRLRVDLRPEPVGAGG